MLIMMQCQLFYNKAKAARPAAPRTPPARTGALVIIAPFGEVVVDVVGVTVLTTEPTGLVRTVYVLPPEVVVLVPTRCACDVMTVAIEPPTEVIWYPALERADGAADVTSVYTLPPKLVTCCV